MRLRQAQRLDDCAVWWADSAEIFPLPLKKAGVPIIGTLA